MWLRIKLITKNIMRIYCGEDNLICGELKFLSYSFCKNFNNK